MSRAAERIAARRAGRERGCDIKRTSGLPPTDYAEFADIKGATLPLGGLMNRTAIAALLAIAAPALAQRPPAVVSPEVKPDRTVVFRIAAPKANAVTVVGEFGKKELTKDDRGVWSVTVG